MIGSLRGQLLDKDPVGEVVIEVAGLGYRVTVNAGTLAAFGDVGEQAFFDLFDHIFDEWVSYEDTIALWERHFEQVYVGLFDDLKATPDPFYASVCEFLGIEALAPETRQLGGVVNKGIEMDIPKPFLNYLIEQYADEIRWWSERKNQSGDQYAWASKYAL